MECAKNVAGKREFINRTPPIANIPIDGTKVKDCAHNATGKCKARLSMIN